MKILCFTGTGNSLEVAKKIAKRNSGEIVSIPKLISEGIYDVTDDAVGIVFPIYYLSVPKMVDEYLRNLRINSKYTFVVVTHANLSFESKVLATNYSFSVDYFNQIKMPNNFIPWFDLEASNNKLDYQQNLLNIESDIVNKISNTSYNYWRYLAGNVVRKLHKPNPNYLDLNFYITNKCTRCKLCERVCVANNIVIRNQIQFKNNCEQCMACINICPQNAIHHKKEKSTARYVNEKISLRELIDVNDVRS